MEESFVTIFDHSVFKGETAIIKLSIALRKIAEEQRLYVDNLEKFKHALHQIKQKDVYMTLIGVKATIGFYKYNENSVLIYTNGITVGTRCYELTLEQAVEFAKSLKSFINSLTDSDKEYGSLNICICNEGSLIFDDDNEEHVKYATKLMYQYINFKAAAKDYKYAPVICEILDMIREYQGARKLLKPFAEELLGGNACSYEFSDLSTMEYINSRIGKLLIISYKNEDTVGYKVFDLGNQVLRALVSRAILEYSKTDEPSSKTVEIEYM